MCACGRVLCKSTGRPARCHVSGCTHFQQLHARSCAGLTPAVRASCSFLALSILSFVMSASTHSILMEALPLPERLLHKQCRHWFPEQGSAAVS